eukprot:UN25541
MLSTGIYNTENLEESTIRVGRKLAQSLLLGRPYRAVFTGSSNTAGHDNMFVSAYPNQLAHLMRTFWADIGYSGAAFESIDAAIGGHLGTHNLCWCLQAIVGDNPDMIFWESYMNDGGSPHARGLEVFWRNAIANPNRPTVATIKTNADKDREGNLGKWFPTSAPTTFRALETHYNDAGAGYVGFWLLNGRTGFYDTDPYKYMNVNWHPNPFGHRVMAQVLAYFLYWGRDCLFG